MLHIFNYEVIENYLTKKSRICCIFLITSLGYAKFYSSNKNASEIKSNLAYSLKASVEIVVTGNVY